MKKFERKCIIRQEKIYTNRIRVYFSETINESIGKEKLRISRIDGEV